MKKWFRFKIMICITVKCKKAIIIPMRQQKRKSKKIRKKVDEIGIIEVLDRKIPSTDENEYNEKV